MLCYAMLCYAMLCYARLSVLGFVMPFYAMLRSAMLCYAMICHAIPCFAFLHYFILTILNKTYKWRFQAKMLMSIMSVISIRDPVTVPGKVELLCSSLDASLYTSSMTNIK